MAISSKKLLGSKGGSLAVRPKTNLVPLKKQSSSLAKVGGKQEDPMLVIKTKVIKIEDLLKGTLAAEKKAADEKRKQQEQEDRAKQEDEVEAPKTKGKGIKLPIPGKIKSFWGNIKKFIGTVLFGWLALQLLPLIPKLMPILKMLAATADFIINWGGKILSGLVTFVDWGYKAVEGTRKFIENKFGEDAAEKFDSFMGTINKVLNLVIALGMGAAAMGSGKKPPRTPKRGPKNKLKRANQKFKRFTDPKRGDKLKRVKNIKNIKSNKNNLSKKLTKANKLNAQLTKINKQLKTSVSNLKTNLSKTTNNFKNQLAKANKLNTKLRTDLSKNLKTAGTNLKTNLKTTGTQLKTNLKTTGTQLKTNLQTTGTKLKDTGGKIVKRLGMKMNKGMVQSMKGLSKMAKGVRIPIVGPLIAALFSYLADGKWDKALFVGIGTALGEMLGTAIPIPVLGTILGGLVGFYIGDLLFTLFRGGGINEVLTKLKGDLLKVFNVGKTVGKWANTGFDRLIKGIPTVKVPLLGEVLNPVWIANPANIVAKAKLIGKAFLSRDPMKEEKDKKDKEEKKKTNIKKDKEGYLSMLSSGKKGKIEQALYEMRINSVKPGEAHYDYVGNPKYAEDVDLIMKHGMQKVEIDNGRVTLQGNANNIVSTNGVSNKVSSVSSSASYEEGSDKEIVVVNTKNNSSMGSNQPTEEGKVVAVETGSGSGSGSDATASLYRG